MKTLNLVNKIIPYDNTHAERGNSITIRSLLKYIFVCQ